jgi:F-box interacting protein
LLPYDNRGLGYFDFTFGYDASTRVYKVVAFRVNEIEGKSEVKVFSLGDYCWRNIQSFPMVPNKRLKKGVHFSGTVNWLAYVEQLVIVSLCLSTESYKQFQLPPGFDEVPFSQPVLRVLMDCLCFSYDSNKTEFVLWQMKQYGVHESWTQFFKISYQNLQKHNIDVGFQLACLYVNGDMMIFATALGLTRHDQAFIYNFKDKTVERIKCRNNIRWFDYAKDYVESLVSVC